ncbi:hypothetical protein N1851_000482 [Merluccius polli]|uniref:Gypsy retrotransposon integrase-like protein 1 n=1 Tax=Merluccius polli TaxID=89951 RepID=A0AA47ND31_MERPO|nr:hypothetical protein N1851_000482 [Merluccius polli]
MAKFNPPTNFSFDKPAEWPDWKQRFVRFRSATKLNKEDGAVQVSSLIYAMGSESENIFRSFTFTDEGQQDNFDVVLAKFDEYFVPRRNVIHERARFHQRIQRPGEKAETFIRALYELSEHCDFGASREENIRDRIVVGILDKEVSRKLQLVKDLTLAVTIETVRQSEEVASQVSMQEEATGAVHEVSHKFYKNAKFRGKQRGGNKGCGKCGKERHSQEENCPARESTCNTCNKVGHWSRVCRNKKAVSEVTEQQQSYSEQQRSYFLGAVSKAADGSSEQWAVKLLVGSTPVEFKIDTGADVNIIREETYHSLRPKTPLEPADIPLDSPGGELQCIGQFQSTVAYKGKTHPLTAYVICGRTVSNLLSRPLAVKMNLVRRVEETVCSTGHLQAYGEHGTLKTEPRLLMRLMRFNPVAEYAPGKTLVVADTLSRSPLSSMWVETDTQSDVACYVASVVGAIPASQSKLDEMKMATASDANLQSVIKFIHTGWPEHISRVPVSIRAYVQVKAELSEHNGLVLRGCRIVVPQSMREEILQKIHQGHQGLVKCRERACSSVWWPGLSTEISNLVSSCQVCHEQKRTQQKEPLISTPLPDRPWKRIAMDLCEYNHQDYLVISDYYSRFIEILHMSSTTSTYVIQRSKAIFARFGIPDEVVTDNGPQFSSAEFHEFAKQLDFRQCTSSPHHPQGNGHAERAVQTAKKILKQADPVMALLIYRSTPCSSTGYSPAELLMGRRIRTTLPTLEKNLQPKWPSRAAVKARDEQEKAKQAYYYNRRH